MNVLALSGNTLVLPAFGDCRITLPGVSVPTVYVIASKTATSRDDFTSQRLLVENHVAGVTFVWPSNTVGVGLTVAADVIAAGSFVYTIDSVRGKLHVVKTSGLGEATSPTTPDLPLSANFTYTDGLLSRIDYVGGTYKTFAYDNGLLVQSVWHKVGSTVTKDFTYTDGQLSNVVVTIA